MFRPLAVSLAAVLCATPAVAEFKLLGGGNLSFTSKEDGTDHDVDGYVEVEVNGFYAGVWAELADGNSEFDYVGPYIGYRGEAGKLSYEGALTYYFDPDYGTKDGNAELWVNAEYAFDDKLTLGTEAFYVPEYKYGSLFVYAEYFFHEKVSVWGYYGRYQDKYYDEDQRRVGISYYPNDDFEIWARLKKWEYSEPTATLGISWDTEFFKR